MFITLTTGRRKPIEQNAIVNWSQIMINFFFVFPDTDQLYEHDDEHWGGQQQ